MKIITTIITSLVLAATAFAGNLVNVSGASKIAVNGYDTVAFFTEEKPVHGSPSITAEHQGATYLFSSEENKAKFEKSPEKYAPQFGGFCAYGASVGALFPIDIDTFQIIDGKLYLNLNPEIVKVFNKDQADNLAKAKKVWPELEKKNSK
jgi:YHS domain-containing protein